METYKVELSLFQDDANGEWGLAHSNAINNSYENSFNAFWSGIGIFHDVFEHYFEDKNKYFLGDYAFNIGGEVAAMGHLAYYWNTFRPQNRRINPNNIYSFEDGIISSTESEMSEAITYGYWNFGNKLLCNTPKAKKEDYNYYLENIIQEHLYKIKKCTPRKDEYYDDLQFAQQKLYKKSITESKLRSLYTWGWKQAENIIPDTSENLYKIEEFIAYWDKFTKQHKAEDLANYLEKLIFTITPGDDLKWSCEWVNNNQETINHSDVESEIYYLEELELN